MEIVQPRELTQGEAAVRSFLARVYGWMFWGLAATAFTGWWIARDEALLGAVLRNYRGIALVGVIVPMLLVGAVFRMGRTGATVGFMAYALFQGVFMSIAFAFVEKPVVISAFLLTGGIFGAMSVWGYVTKGDLSSVGSLCGMALLGLVLASIVNLFVASDALSWVVTYGVVAAICGLTAYDTQKVKNLARAEGGADPSRAAVLGAFVLYLDFIVLFWQVLRILSARRR